MESENDFISSGSKEYKFKIGKRVASSLSGFIAGVVVATIVWFAAHYVINILR
jgi:hypothetical protein